MTPKMKYLLDIYVIPVTRTNPIDGSQTPYNVSILSMGEGGD